MNELEKLKQIAREAPPLRRHTAGFGSLNVAVGSYVAANFYIGKACVVAGDGTPRPAGEVKSIHDNMLAIYGVSPLPYDPRYYEGDIPSGKIIIQIGDLLYDAEELRDRLVELSGTRGD